MKTIYKYVFTLKNTVEEFDMPSDSIPLCVNMQGNNICLWCIVNTDNPVVKRRFCVIGTGWEIPVNIGAYIGSVFPSPYVFHVFIVNDI